MNSLSKVLDHIRSDVSEKDFEKWIKPSNFFKDTDGCVVEAPNSFILNRLLNTYAGVVKRAFAQVLGEGEVMVTFRVREKELDKVAISSQPIVNNDFFRDKPRTSPALTRGQSEVKPLSDNRAVKGFNPRYNFDSFVVGSSNQFAHAACVAVADQPGSHYNPLFIYGGVGLGKTHLLHAIGLSLLKINPGIRIIYLSSEKFINDLINSLRLKRMDDFRRRYRNDCDVLLIDDIQFIAGKERSMEEFFHTFNSLYELKKQIILTSDKVPKDIPDLEARLCSRFEWGLIADIQPPDLETRMAILKRKAEDHSLVLDDDVVLFLASSIRNNIRELEGSLSRLTAYASLMGREINLEFAREVFRDLISEERQITIPGIQNVVAKAYNIKATDLCSTRKFKYIALPRQIAMYLARKLTKASFPDIGNQFGGKDHSTVVHAVRKIEKQLIDDTSLKNSLDSLEKTIRFGGDQDRG